MVLTAPAASGRPQAGPGAEPPGAAAGLYLDLLKQCLTRSLFPDPLLPVTPRGGRLRRAGYAAVARLLRPRGLVLAWRDCFDSAVRARGGDFPAEAETMIGLNRLGHLQACVEDVLRRGVPGDFLEAGVWRGGACIFMRAALQAYGDPTRVVWAADSFRGQPPPDPGRYPRDAGDTFWTMDLMKVSLADVRRNFARYGLLDDRVRFLVGWFRDTLPAAPIERLALLRVDGDLYESTLDALRALYPKLSVGGYAIIDDYALPACRAAVEDFRAAHGVAEPLEPIEWTGAYWRRLG
jgi:O-methyltransferase